jgi:hypothetical protein
MEWSSPPGHRSACTAQVQRFDAADGERGHRSLDLVGDGEHVRVQVDAVLDRPDHDVDEAAAATSHKDGAVTRR